MPRLSCKVRDTSDIKYIFQINKVWLVGNEYIRNVKLESQKNFGTTVELHIFMNYFDIRDTLMFMYIYYKMSKFLIKCNKQLSFLLYV